MISKPLTFGELKIGEYFIGFPTYGDDSGHGGYKGSFYVYKKTKPTLDKIRNIYQNAIKAYSLFRKMKKIRSNFPNTMLVCKVILYKKREESKTESKTVTKYNLGAFPKGFIKKVQKIMKENPSMTLGDYFRKYSKG